MTRPGSRPRLLARPGTCAGPPRDEKAAVSLDAKAAGRHTGPRRYRAKAVSYRADLYALVHELVLGVVKVQPGVHNETEGRRAKALSLAARRQWETQGKGAVLSRTKAVGNTGRWHCLSRHGLDLNVKHRRDLAGAGTVSRSAQQE